MDNAVLVWRVVDWDGRYETAGSLKKRGPLAAVEVSTDLGCVGLRRLLGLPGAAEILGVWYFLQMPAAQGDRRGVLCHLGKVMSSDDISRLSGFEVSLIEQAFLALSDPGIGLLERVPLDVALQPPVIPPSKPRKPRTPRPKAFAQCPQCQADLVSLAASGQFDHLLIAEQDNECGHDACACHGSESRCSTQPAPHRESSCRTSPSPDVRRCDASAGDETMAARRSNPINRVTTSADSDLIHQVHAFPGNAVPDRGSTEEEPVAASPSHDARNPMNRVTTSATGARHANANDTAVYRKKRKAARVAKRRDRKLRDRR